MAKLNGSTLLVKERLKNSNHHVKGFQPLRDDNLKQKNLRILLKF